MPSRFRRVLDAPHVRLLLAAALLARLPYGILGLATVVFVHERTGSFASAGAVSAASTAASAIGLPVLGRVVDRVGQTRVLLTSAVLHAAGLLTLVALGLGGAGVGWLLLAAAVGGFFVPPISPALRGIWNAILDGEEQVRTALALDAIVLEIVFIGAPLATAVILVVASPQVALVLAAALAAAGACLFASSPASRAWRGVTERAAGRLGPLVAPGIRTIVLATVALGIPLGGLEVALPAFGVEHGSAGLGGVAIAAFAVGSGIAGVWYGAKAPSRVVDIYLLLTSLLPFGIALLALAGSPLSMLLLAPLAGAVLAPLTAASNELAGVIAPAGTVTEAYAWVVTATIAGVSAGTAIAGAVVEARDWRAAVLLGAVAALVGAVLALARRGTLVRPV